MSLEGSGFVGIWTMNSCSVSLPQQQPKYKGYHKAQCQDPYYSPDLYLIKLIIILVKYTSTLINERKTQNLNLIKSTKLNKSKYNKKINQIIITYFFLFN